MNQVLFLILFFVSGQLFAAENLMRDDYDGAWKSNNAAVKYEKQILKISLNSKTVFERHFDGKDPQVLNTEKHVLLDDLLVLTFNSPDNVFGYKLALSGWKSKKRKTLYGSMFMYRNGVQFNMLPVSFESAD